MTEPDDISAVLGRFRRFIADPTCGPQTTLTIHRATVGIILAAMDGATVVANHAGGRIRELETDIARLRKIDDERHARVAADINRRVDVETELLRFSAGKRGPIEPEEAQRLALKLGVPEWFNEMVAEKAGRAPREGGEETRS